MSKFKIKIVGEGTTEEIVQALKDLAEDIDNNLASSINFGKWEAEDSTLFTTVSAVDENEIEDADK